jgi:hypothetical protein
MPTKDGKLTESDRRNMRAVMDRLIPPVDELPGAGSMGLLAKVEEMAASYGRFGKSLTRFAEALSMDMAAGAQGGFRAMDGEQQDEAIREIEAALPDDFSLVLEVVYLAYYSDERVHRRIGWRTGPLQPMGFPLAKFDESVLETARKRPPFWRHAPE